jgi:hypothetical protein
LPSRSDALVSYGYLPKNAATFNSLLQFPSGSAAAAARVIWWVNCAGCTAAALVIWWVNCAGCTAATLVIWWVNCAGCTAATLVIWWVNCGGGATQCQRDAKQNSEHTSLLFQVVMKSLD